MRICSAFRNVLLVALDVEKLDRMRLEVVRGRHDVDRSLDLDSWFVNASYEDLFGLVVLN